MSEPESEVEATGNGGALKLTAGSQTLAEPGDASGAVQFTAGASQDSTGGHVTISAGNAADEESSTAAGGSPGTANSVASSV